MFCRKGVLKGCLHDISFREKWNVFISVSAQLLITVYMIQPERKLIAGVIWLRSFWGKLNFISGDKISCKYYSKQNHMKGNISTCIYFIKTKMLAFCLMSRFFRTNPEVKFHFILSARKINVNRIAFMVEWNFISGRFHFGSHENTPLEISQNSQKNTFTRVSFLIKL